PIAKNTAKTQPSPSKATQRSMQSPQKTAIILPTQQDFFFKQEKCIPVMCSTSSTSLSALAREHGGVSYKDAVPESSKIVMSTDIFFLKTEKEDITEKKSTKRPSQQPLPYVPLSPKLPKTKVHASEEEVLSSEGNVMPVEEELPDESQNAPLNSANSLNPASRNPISIHTAVSWNFPQSVPCTSDSALVGTTSPTKSSHHEVKFQMQRKSEAPGYIAVPDPSVLKQGFSKDPSTWSVDEVILFLKHVDPQTLTPLADLFRQHEIDGKALLLLKSDVMMKYMGLKLGPALKLCYYIEKLKEGKYN
ncbi:Sex comb on midleg-like protein 2, partial [Camelus dromedarius]